MRKFTMELSEEECNSLVEGYKTYLTSEGGITDDEVKDYDILAVLNYAVYAHSEMIVGLTIRPNFKETTVKSKEVRIK